MQYDAPAFLKDFASIPGMAKAWSAAVSTWFDGAIEQSRKKTGGGAYRYYNAATTSPQGLALDQAISWNAFPKDLLRQYSRGDAMQLADRLWIAEMGRNQPVAVNPDLDLAKANVLCRPLDEYCEWRVERDPGQNKVRRITFTSEPPEYWQAMSGLVPGDPDLHFPATAKSLLRLYRAVVDPQIQLRDLIAQQDICDRRGKVLVKKGTYNIYNKWNTTHGIAHLNCPPNSLIAEIQLGADASVLYRDPAGRLLEEPEALIAYAAYGGVNRNSDPTIGATVNALTRSGLLVTLANPVGLYMDHIDLSGWETPDGAPPETLVKIVRGSPGMIERLVVAVPSGKPYEIGDVRIAGEPILYGGQVAECITVKLVGRATVVAKPAASLPGPPQSRAAIDPTYPRLVVGLDALEDPLPPGSREAYMDQGTGGSAKGMRENVAKRTLRQKDLRRR